MNSSSRVFACPQCGMPTSGEGDYCSQCGEPLTIACASCGATWRYYKGYRYCPACGAKAERRGARDIKPQASPAATTGRPRSS